MSRDDERYVSGNAMYFRMDRIVDIYFVGGFGTVQWVKPVEYAEARPDKIVLETPNHTLQALNQAFSSHLRETLSQNSTTPADDAVFISVDRLGADVRIRRGGDYCVERIGFDRPVESLAEVAALLEKKFMN